MEMECIIMSLIYMERLTKETGGALQVELTRTCAIGPESEYCVVTGALAQLEEPFNGVPNYEFQSMGRFVHVEC